MFCCLLLLFLILDFLLFFYLFICPLLFFVLDILLFYHFIIYPLLFFCPGSSIILLSCYIPVWSHLELFFSFIILFFFVIKFQLFYCHLVFLVYFFFLDLYFLNYSNNFCQISLSLACQPAMQSLVVCSWLLTYTISIIITIHII